MPTAARNGVTRTSNVAVVRSESWNNSSGSTMFRRYIEAASGFWEKPIAKYSITAPRVAMLHHMMRLTSAEWFLCRSRKSASVASHITAHNRKL